MLVPIDDVRVSIASLLLRRFVFRMAEASAKPVTGDTPQGTMGRVQTSRPLSPSRLPLRAHRERRLGTRQMHSGTSLLHYCVFTELCKWKILHICSSLKTCTPGLFFYLLHNFLSKHNIFSSGIMIFKQLCKYRPPPLSPISSPHPSQKNSIDDFNYSLNYCCSTGLLCGLWTIVIIDLICGCWTIFFPGNKNKYHI